MEKIEYMIVHVGEHPNPKKKDIVAVSLEPTERFNENYEPVEMIGQGIPPEVRQVLQIMEKSVHKTSQTVDERNIVILKPKIEFIDMGWKYGDVIEVSFKKIKEAKDVKPRGEM